MWFAFLMRLASRYHEPWIRTRKQALLSTLKGQVLEIGPGNGVNLQYLSADVQWTGYEPNPHLARDIQLPHNARLHIEPFHHAQGPFDAAISTLVLCSVDNPARVLKSIYDALKPGGSLIFVEHVAAPPANPLRKWQHFCQPLWSACAGGCHPNRDTLNSIEAAGFTIKSVEHFNLPLWLAAPHIAGEAIKP